MGIVAFHVAWRPYDKGFALDAAGRLRAAWERVNFRHDYDLRLSGAPTGPDIGGHAGSAGFHREADRFQYLLDKLGALDLLHSELAEIVDGVADGGDLFGITLDHFTDECLCIVGLGQGRRGERPQKKRNGDPLHNVFADHHRLLPHLFRNQLSAIPQ